MKKIFIISLVVTGFIFSSVSAMAATISLQSDFSTLRVGDVFVVDLKIDTERQTLNAIELELLFPNDIFEYVDIDEGNSTINLWMDKPSYREPNLISFSGITPGGFFGTDTEILSLTFRAKMIGQGNIEINQASVLLHDGLGTEAKVTEQNLHLAVIEGDSDVAVLSVDDEMPEHFIPEIIKDADLYDGAYTLIFATEDKGSGLHGFMIKEGWFDSYKEAESPYQLKNQLLNKKITIKAIDKQGNERVEVLYPQNWQPFVERRLVVVSIIVLCVLSIFSLLRFFGIWPKKQQ